ERALGRGRSPSRRVADPANVCGYRTSHIMDVKKVAAFIVAYRNIIAMFTILTGVHGRGQISQW
ncbi:hypothetical protein ACSDR0_46525, partial [Streptosporangium sp. G11]|uniref:hypothetical protein n=1 Tax=Streptosporangium sp. G11 TaxID=3436926 RepID=UPI003EBC148D